MMLSKMLQLYVVPTEFPEIEFAAAFLNNSFYFVFIAVNFTNTNVLCN